MVECAVACSAWLQTDPAGMRLAIGARIKPLSASNSVLHLRGGMVEQGRRVVFKRWAVLEKGEILLVSGDGAALGDNAPEKAVPMKLGADGKTWSVEVKDVPLGTRYRYIAAQPGDVAGTNRPTANPNYKLQVYEPEVAKGPTLEMDNTVRARRSAASSGQALRSIKAPLHSLAQKKLLSSPSRAQRAQHAALR